MGPIRTTLRWLARILLPVALVASAALAAEPPGESDRAAIRDVISRQLEAFRRDDGPTAFGFAAPVIRRHFGDADTFMAMVRNGYEPLHRSSDFAFRDLRQVDDVVIQRVHVVGRDGAEVTAVYVMQRQPDGSWRIAGCTLAAPELRST